MMAHDVVEHLTAEEREWVEDGEISVLTVPTKHDVAMVLHFARELNAARGTIEAVRPYLEECKRLAIDRIRTADAAVKVDVYAADALMGIAKNAHDALAILEGK